MCGIKQTLERSPTMTTTILPATNTEWGFWGAIARIENNPAVRRDPQPARALPRGGDPLVGNDAHQWPPYRTAKRSLRSSVP